MSRKSLLYVCMSFVFFFFIVVVLLLSNYFTQLYAIRYVLKDQEIDS